MDKTIDAHVGCVTSRVIKTHNGYGLFIICGEGKSKIYPDISHDVDLVCGFSDKINQGSVSPLHIDDVIEDMLG